MKTAYWTTTILIALALCSGGAAYLFRAEAPLRGMAELGYPAYFVTNLGVWKVLGALAIVAPGFPRLKEWAYAGIAFDLTGAALSHVAAGQPLVRAIAPLALLAIAAVSWALRPATRKIGAAPGEWPSPGADRRELVKAA
jgi:DoxX-like family